jgi:hypothetical protein
MRIEAACKQRREQALACFTAEKAKTDTMPARLSALRDERFGYPPDEIHRSHVGLLGQNPELPRRLGDAAFNEGEHTA